MRYRIEGLKCWVIIQGRNTFVCDGGKPLLPMLFSSRKRAEQECDEPDMKPILCRLTVESVDE